MLSRMYYLVEHLSLSRKALVDTSDQIGFQSYLGPPFYRVEPALENPKPITQRKNKS